MAKLTLDVSGQLQHLLMAGQPFLENNMQIYDSAMVQLFCTTVDPRVRTSDILPVRYHTYTEGMESRCQYGAMIYQFLPRASYLLIELMRLSHNADMPWVQQKQTLLSTSLCHDWLDNVWADRAAALDRATRQGMGVKTSVGLTVECAICIMPLVASSKYHVTACGHAFHHSCIAKWLETGVTCPLCRRVLAQ